MLPIQNILSRLHGVTKTGENKYMACCPAHDDKNASLAIEEKADKILMHCHTGCKTEAVLAAIGLRFSDICPDKAQTPKMGLTLAEYSRAKALPEDFLKQLGITETPFRDYTVIQFPYYNEKGEWQRSRIRYSMDKSTRRFWWDKSQNQILLYGLWLQPSERDTIIIVEGESDTQTLLFNGFPALGLPGAANYKPERDDTILLQYKTVFVHIEPDTGGKTVFAKFQHSQLNILFFTLQGNHKDPSDLWLKLEGNKEEFRRIVSNSLANAKKAADFQEEHKALLAPSPSASQTKPAPASQAAEAPGRGRPKADYLAFVKRVAKSATWLYMRDSWYEYQKEDGIYKHIPDNEFYPLVMDLIQAETEGDNEFHLEASKNAQTNAIENLKPFCLCLFNGSMNGFIINKGDKQMLRIDGDYAVMNNGILDIKKAAVFDGTDAWEPYFQPFSNQFFSLTKLPFDYVPNAQCPKFHKFLSEIFPDQELQLVIQRMLGYFCSSDTRAETMFWFLGTGANGKSTLIRIIRALLGNESISNLNIPEMQERFSKGILTEKRLNICEETNMDSSPNVNIQYAETLKKVSTHDEYIMCEEKGKKPTQARITARLLFATNSLPPFYDKSNGLIRRMCIIPFEQSFIGKENPDLADEIIADELPGIFNWALEGLYDIQNRNIKDAFKCAATEQQAKIYADHLEGDTEFFEDNISANHNYMISETDVYRAYKDFIYENGKRPRSKDTMRESVFKKYKIRPTQPLKLKNNSTRFYVGLQFTQNNMADKNHIAPSGK